MALLAHLFGRLELSAHKQAVGAIHERARIVAIGAHCKFGVLLRGLVVALCVRVCVCVDAGEFLIGL